MDIYDYIQNEYILPILPQHTTVHLDQWSAEAVYPSQVASLLS
jgi:hypothetical protein